MTSAAPRHVLRTLLRAIDTNITSVTGNTTWRRYALDEFRRVPANAPDAASRLQQAEDYAFLLTSVREFKELLACYNIGIPIEQRERDMNKAAARLVGLAMPPKQPDY